MGKRFEVDPPDFVKSPFNGLTKEHYIGGAKYILERAFSHYFLFY
jgi:hypothetical protein